MFPEIDSIPHLDTLERLLEDIPADKIEDVLGKTIRKLLRTPRLSMGTSPRLWACYL